MKRKEMMRMNRVARVMGLLLAAAVVLPCLLGCNGSPGSSSGAASSPSPAVPNNQVTALEPGVAIGFATDSVNGLTPPEIDPLKMAHESYLKAYDTYVFRLRESGPQTIETLHALADYQKKYQIYQMLLNAERKALPQGWGASTTSPD
jgi:hypothetical protein